MDAEQRAGKIYCRADVQVRTGRLAGTTEVVEAMRLACIRDSKARSEEAKHPNEIAMPRNAEAAHRLFRRGVNAMRADEEGDAFRIFDRLADYTGEAPDGLVDAAKLGRVLLDPDLTPKEKADQFFDLFPGQIIHIYNADQGDGVMGSLSPDSYGEPGRAVMSLDPPTMAWLTYNDLFTSAFRSLERGDLDQADQAFAEFLDRTTDDPSACLRATAMLARAAIDASRSNEARRPEPDHIISQCVTSVIQARR